MGEVTSNEKSWRCFHCDEVFTTEVDARLHFGIRDGDEPACKIKAPGEFALLDALRDAQTDLMQYWAEDTKLIRAMHSMQADHQTALRREEEKGYARGLRDAQQLCTGKHGSQETCVSGSPAVETKAPLPRIRLKEDIYDDGADHHPPGILARKGDVVEVREFLSVGVAHRGAPPGQAFIVRVGEHEPVESAQEITGNIEHA